VTNGLASPSIFHEEMDIVRARVAKRRPNRIIIHAFKLCKNIGGINVAVEFRWDVYALHLEIIF